MTSSRPNILVVICDDLGVGDLTSSGNSIVRTPRLDAFRAEGASAERHVSGPLCSPARACLLTGRYHYRNRVTDTYCGRSMLDPDAATLADLLSAAGYRTGCFGKWHLGDNCPFRPQDRGFRETLVHGSGGIGQPGDAPENAGRDSYFDPVLSRNGEPERVEGYCTDIFADAAVDFIARDSSQPWFAYLALNAPHTPLQVDPALVESCRRRGATGDVAALYALVEGIDAAFGRVLDAIGRSGQADNTIVHFTSDHGPCPGVLDEDGRQRFNAGLRGQKGDPYEGGGRVPSFWRWPQGWKSGHCVTATTHVIDVMPTILESAGLDRPANLDGVSLAGALAGGMPDDALDSRTVFLQWHRGDRPVLHRNAAAWQGAHKWLRVCECGPDELYDLDSDPGETSNLATSDPERCRAMREAYERWFADVGSPHDYEPLRIHIGDDREPVTLLSRQDWRVTGPDGWSSGHLGHWPLEVVAPGRYAIEAIFESPPPERGSVLLKLDGRPVCMEAQPGRSTYRYESIPLDAGPLVLSAYLTTRFSFQSVLYLRVSADCP